MMNSTEAGMVKAKTRISTGEMASIIKKEPKTVMALAAICNRSLDSEAVMVSMS